MQRTKNELTYIYSCEIRVEIRRGAKKGSGLVSATAAETDVMKSSAFSAESTRKDNRTTIRIIVYFHVGVTYLEPFRTYYHYRIGPWIRIT